MIDKKNDYPERRIRLNKVKIVLIAIGCIMAVAGGMSMMFLSENVVADAIAFCAVVFFFPCGLFAIRALCDSTSGLMFNQFGMVDHSNGVSCGEIPWSDIIGIDYFEGMIAIRIQNPKDYLSTGNVFQRMIKKSKYKRFGTPICIGSDMLDIPFDELCTTVEHYVEYYKRPV